MPPLVLCCFRFPLLTSIFFPVFSLFLFRPRLPPRFPLFPYTTLFRSHPAGRPHHIGLVRGGPGGARPLRARQPRNHRQDRKSTRLNSSHVSTSYAVFCLKKKKIKVVTGMERSVVARMHEVAGSLPVST